MTAALLLLLSSVLLPALAAPQATLDGSRADHTGVQQATGALAGLRVQSAAAMAATFTLDGRDVVLHTENATQGSVGQVSINPVRGGDDRTWANVTLRSGTARSDLDFLVLPMEGRPAPAVALASRSLGLVRTDRDELAEAPYVDSRRPVFRGDVRGTALGQSSAVDELVVTGAFRVSVWSWDFTVDDGQGNRTYPTGVHSSPTVSDPVTGQPVASDDFDQVAQLQVADGTLRLQALATASVAAYSPSLAVASIGRFTLSNAVGLLDAAGGGQLGGRDLSADGTLASRSEPSGAGVRVVLESFEGTMAVAGKPVSLGADGPLRQAGAGGGGLAAPVLSWSIGLGLSVVLLGVAVLVLKGPARRARFNRIEGRFEAKDYGWVLQRIEPFTGRHRYRRRAALLKAVSLLSLEDYREAALYLETLDPSRGPDAATKAFLQACAAAGLQQDDVAIERLGECFRLDPSYMREARFVPMLAGYLPYFSLSPEFA